MLLLATRGVYTGITAEVQPILQNLIDDARAIFRAAVQGAQADLLCSRVDWGALAKKPLEAYRHVYVVGMGKAAMAMASTVEKKLGTTITDGCVVVPQGYSQTLPYPYTHPRIIEVLEAAHPLPDRTSEEAAHVLLELADRCGDDDLLIVLISGGGSSLTTHFAEGIHLEDGQRVVQDLMRAGADIRALNTVRKHISLMGGGRLARRAMPAEVVSLVISDVVGDDLSIIASGPTIGDPTRVEDAIRVLREYDLWERVPASISSYLNTAKGDIQFETPDPEDPIFENVITQIIGTNRMALEAGCREASSRSLPVTVSTDWIEGEARVAGRRLAHQLMDYSGEKPHCFLWGGETTVTVKGKGIGGRNQELALAAAIAFDGYKSPVILLSGGTDGIDGPTEAAGAYASPKTLQKARNRKRDPQAYLEANDAHTFFLEMNALLKPGPTHTNVMDIIIGIIA